MPDGVEIELKLAASPEMLQQLRAHPALAGDERALALVAKYFDTADGELYRQGASLRLRDGDGTREQTFKRAAGSGVPRRGEWDAPADGDAPDFTAFPPRVRKQIDRLLGGAPLVQLASTRVGRTTRRVRFGASTIEAAFDCGAIEANGRSEAISELELELIDGAPADIFALALQLPLGEALGWSAESKGERGYALALGRPFAAVRAGKVAVSREMDVDQGFAAVAWSCLGHLLGNYREVIASGNPEAVHQARVAIRRLRAAFSVFGGVVTGTEAQVFRAEWKAAGGALGPARDLQVLAERTEQAARDGAGDAAELLGHLAQRRAAATAEAQALLAGAPFQRLLIGFAEWIERKGWREADCSGSSSLQEFAGRTLSRHRRKVVKAGNVEQLSDRDLHALRIKGKKLRYAAEFFAALYPGQAESRRAFGKALARLQDRLGTIHDIDVAHEQHGSLFGHVEPVARARLSAQLAQLLETQGRSRRRLVRSAAKALERVAAAPAWWKAAAAPD